jgi:GTPase SAR1 family protein
MNKIWDTAGQERYHALATSYYRGADAIILVFDVTCRSTFDSVANWLLQIKNVKTTSLLLVLDLISSSSFLLTVCSSKCLCRSDRK